MKKFYFYFALLSLIPFIFFTGGVESPMRFLYYPIMVLLIAVFDSKTLLQASLTFSIVYCLIPFARGSEYPFYTVIINVLPFLLTAIPAGRISDMLKQERDSLRKTTDTFHGVTNTLNLQIMNLQSKIDALSETCNRLKELSENRIRFISGVSHEIRSPLSSIRSFSEILLNYDDIDEKTRREFLNIINEESERLTDLTNEILDIVAIEFGKIQWQMDEVDMTDVVESAVATIIPLTKNKGLSVENNIPQRHFFIRGDKNRLFQVMLNLLSNALKFTSQGKISVGIEESADDLKVYVSDTGEGIYPEEKDKIFEEFYRIGDGLAGRPKGAGIGLSISKKIIEAHKGRIWVESQLGKGSTFFFTLPKEEIILPKVEDVDTGADFHGRHILVLENYKPLRQVLRVALETLGFKTTGAESTKQGLDIAKMDKPDAIVIGYPKNEDYFGELRILSRIQGIPLFLVIVIDDEQRGFQIAVNGYISKPFDKNQILSTLEQVLPRKRGKILIISHDNEEARNVQLLIGIHEYETIIVPDLYSHNLTRHMPDVIVVGISLSDEVYSTIRFLRSNQTTVKIPLLLILNSSQRDINYIGLNSSAYGSGLKKIAEKMKEGIFSSANH